MPPLKARGGNLVEPSRHGSACGMSDERGVYGDWGESSGSSGQGTNSICGLPRADATGGSVVGNPRCCPHLGKARADSVSQRAV
jgi:hypothetical protein